MSMYDLAMGDGAQQARGAVLLRFLGDPDVGRFRDAWVEKGDDGKPVIAVYTRNGGGNRECYCEDYAEEGEEPHKDGPCTALIANETLPAHPLYLRDADDDFDSTYATFYFRVPDEHLEMLQGLAVEPVNMSERWQAIIDALGNAADSSRDRGKP